MFGYFLLGIALVTGVWLVARAFLSADPRTLALTVRYGGIVLAITVVVFLTLTGRLGTAMMLGALAFPLLTRWRALRDALWPSRGGGGAGGGGDGGQTSTVETLYLRMVLHHDTGAMTGDVLHGAWRGRTLDSLTLGQLLALLGNCRGDDPRSAAVLEAWLDRNHPDWRGRPEEEAGGSTGSGTAGSDTGGRRGDRSGSGTGGGSMTREEAYEILGLSSGATAGQVKDAHRRLMMKVHPDHGGSTYLAAKINQAKDLLLRG